MATVFHWQPSTFDKMYLDELMEWREQARKRVETEDE
ncbi:GpE family phage tail protein [Phocoenobacter uteri]